MSQSQSKASKKKKINLLPIIAAVVVIIVVIAVIVPKLSKNNDEAIKNTEAAKTSQSITQAQSETAQTATGDIVIDEASVGETASFYDFDANGTTVEVFAVKVSDGTVRLALNTCQVCNGSPYAYFVQQGDVFICQNCNNSFERDSIGIVHGGCNPVPITESDYQVSDGKITIPAEFLEQYEQSFANWKKF